MPYVAPPFRVAGFPCAARIQPLLVFKTSATETRPKFKNAGETPAVQKKGPPLFCGAFFFRYGFCLQEQQQVILAAGF